MGSRAVIKNTVNEDRDIVVVYTVNEDRDLV
jgi:hypothetical protein